MAIKPGQSSQSDEKFGFGGGPEKSPFEADKYWIGVVSMVKIFLCFSNKKKEKIQI